MKVLFLFFFQNPEAAGGSMTHFLYLKYSEEVIWIYNILLTEKKKSV